MADIGQLSPSEIQKFHKITSQKKKALIPHMGNKDRKDNFCGTTLLAENRPPP